VEIPFVIVLDLWSMWI